MYQALNVQYFQIVLANNDFRWSMQSVIWLVVVAIALDCFG